MSFMDWREMTGYRTLPDGAYSVTEQLLSRGFPLEYISFAYCDTIGNFHVENEDHRSENDGRFSSASWLSLTCSVCSNMTFVIYGKRLNYRIIDYAQFPRNPGERTANQSWPNTVARYYLQSLASIDSKSWDGAVLLARSALQAIVKDKQASGKNLVNQIDDLFSRGLIVQSLREWSHLVRTVGNEAAHADEDEMTEDDARETVALVGHFINYLYTIPSRIEEQKQRRTP